MTPCPLTPSQLRLVTHLANGFTHSEVAASVGRTREGVKSALKEARIVAGARNSTHLVALAVAGGWIT